jgi:lysophospholipase L1-like esterase
MNRHRAGKMLPWRNALRTHQTLQKHVLRAAVLGGLSACAGPSTPPPSLAPPHIAGAPRFPPTGAEAPLLGLFQALDSIGQPNAAPVALLQIGDSHTANDSFASALRDRLQARFGNAGRGLLQPGIPFKWFRPEAVSVQAAGFTAISAFSNSTVGPFGIASVRQHADQPADATLTETDGGSIGVAEVEFYAQPGGGTVQVAAPPAAPRSISTNGAAGAFFVQVPVAPGSTTLTVHANGDGPVDWLSWSTGRGTQGVTFSNLGIPGSTVAMLDRWDQRVAQAELAHLHPALIIVAFGTNEGFKPSLDLAAYEQDFEQHLAFLHQAAPGATLIIFGAPDGQRARYHTVTTVIMGRHHRKKIITTEVANPGAGEACNGQYAIPALLPQVRAQAQQAAAAQNAYFWDWSAAMGGDCAMARWADAVPPLGMPDHVHMRTPGYAITADALFNTLMRGFDRYRGATGGA